MFLLATGSGAVCVPSHIGPYAPHGAWERPINMFYTGYTFIGQWKTHLPDLLAGTVWVALDRPAQSVFVPLAVGPVPKGYDQGDTRFFSHESAWWTYNLVGNSAQLKFSYMIKDIEERQARYEGAGERLLSELELELAGLAVRNLLRAAFIRSQGLNAHAQAVTEDWKRLFELLVAKYAQGMVNSPEKMAQGVGSPQEWLKKTDYGRGQGIYKAA